MTRHVTRATIQDAGHYTDEQRQAIIAAYPEHERDARAKGIPQLGSGAVYPIAEEKISIDAFQIPDHWALIGGMDFGWDHPFSAIEMAWDRDEDAFYVIKTYKVKKETPIIHAAALRPWGENLPWAWPHDGLQHDKQSGRPLKDAYIEQGLEMLHENAKFEDGSTGVEAGILEILDLMKTDRFKVFSHLNDWFAEYRTYHRKDGRIVKEYDDLLDATRYAFMMKRHALSKAEMTNDVVDYEYHSDMPR